MKLVLKFSAALLMVTVSCHKFEHDNPLDPASDQYDSRPSVLINDFDDDSKGLWGHEHNVFGQRNGNIIKKFTEMTPDGKASRVMQLDYDVSANANSQAIWFQVLA